MDYFSFCSDSRFSISWNSLKYKYEYNIKSNEFHLYQLLTDEVYLLALNMGLNYKLCEALGRVHGFAFCDYGYAGWNAIKEYFANNNINIDLEKMKVDIIKEKIKNIKNIADEEFYGYVDEMFSNNTKTKEVKLVLECYRIIKSLQPIKNYNLNLYYELIKNAIDEIKTKGEIFEIDLNKYIPLDMPKFVCELSEKEKYEYHKNIDNIINEHKEKHPNYSLEKIMYDTVFSLINE